MNLPTLERLALVRLRDRFPDLQRKGFSKAVRAVEPGEIGPLGFIPDGWRVDNFTWADDSPGSVFTAIEIEDSHPLSREKLWLYCDLWDSLEYFGSYLRLFVFDRYGLNERELELGPLYFQFLIEMAKAKTFTPGEKLAREPWIEFAKQVIITRPALLKPRRHLTKTDFDVPAQLCAGAM
jgi:hypothetical protein